MLTFMHYRKYDRQGQIMPHGGLTLAISQEGQAVRVAIAECGRKDHFRKQLGRTIAEGRLNSSSAIDLTLPEDTNTKSYIHNQEFVRAKISKLLAGGK